MNKNTPLDADGKKRVTVKWSNIRMVRFEKKNPHVMHYKYNLQETDFLVATIAHNQQKKTTRHTQSVCASINLKNIHDAPLPITQKRKKGLMKLCLGHPPAIPAPFHHFYTSLPSTGGAVVADDDFNNSDYDDLQG